MTTRRSTSRSHRALALEPRILLDAAATATAETIIAATDTKPGVTAKGVQATIGISQTDTLQSVDLFSGVSVTADNSEQPLSTLVINVTSTGSNQALVIDGSTITLEAASGETTNNAYFFTTEVSALTTTITLQLNASFANSAADIGRLIDSISYATLDNSVESRNVTVTLTSLSDEGDTTELGIRSTIAVTSTINVAPQLTNDTALHAAEQFTAATLSGASEVIYSSDGRYAYVAGENSISVFTADSLGRLTLTQTLSDASALGSISHMAISGDGKSIYTLSGDNKISLLRAASDGQLTYVASYETQNGNATGNLAVSSDGAYVYVGTQSNGLLILNRDTSSGALNVIGRAPEDNSRHATVTTSDRYVYALYNDGEPSLYVYTRNSDGTLETITSTTMSGWRFQPVAYALQASADGQYVFIGDPENDALLVYRFDGSALTRLSSTSLSGISDLALNSTGTLLYTSQRDGTLTTYSVASNGALSQLSSKVSSSGASDIALSRDGLSLLVAGSSLGRYTSVQTLSAGQPSSFASGLTLRDSNYDALASGAGNYDGAKITVSANTTGGTFSLVGSNGLTLSNNVISRNGSEIASLSRSGNNLTVTFNAAVTTDVANQVLKQLTYSNNSAAPGALIRLSVSSTDQALSSNTQEVVLRVNTGPQVHSSAASYTLPEATSETSYSHVLPATLIQDADGDALIWSVTGLPEGLSFDAATRTISGSAMVIGPFPVTTALTFTATDSTGASDSFTVDLVIEQIANRDPQANPAIPGTLAHATENTPYSVVLNRELFIDPDSRYGDTLTWAVTSTLPAGLSFDPATRTLSGTTTALGNYSVTVTVTDSDGKTATRTLLLRVIDQTETDNRPPGLNLDVSRQTYTGDGRVTGADYAVYDIELAPNDQTLVVMGNPNPGAALTPTANSSVYVYARDPQTGDLTLLQTFVQGASNDGNASNGIEINGLTGGTSIAWSDDGSYLYTVGKNSSNDYVINVLRANGDGTLSATTLGTLLGTEQIKQITVSADGNTVYAVSSNRVYSVQVATDGALTLKGSYTEVNTTSASDIEVDDNGTVYVQSSAQLNLYRTNADSTLTYLGKLSRSGTTLNYIDASNASRVVATLPSGSAFDAMRDLTVSKDATIYLVTGVSNYVTALNYDRTNNSMRLVTTFNANQNLGGMPWSVELSADGSALYVGSHLLGSFGIYDINADGTLTWARNTTNSGGNGLRMAVSADGASVYMGGYVYATGLGQVSISNDISLDYLEDSTITLANGLTLSDREYDALNGGAGNYKDAVIRLERAAGANANDSFGFTAGNNLTLENAEIRLNNAVIATFNDSNGTLLLTFTGNVSTAVANQVLQGITYTHTDTSEPDNRIVLQLSVNDEYIASSLNVNLSVIQINDAPTLTATGATADVLEGATPVSLFSDVVVSAVEADQVIMNMTLTVTGLTDGENETLIVGGQTTALIDGGFGSTDDYWYQVTLADGTATIVITSYNGFTGSAAATLLQSLSYANTSEDPTAGERKVSLTAVGDNGGTDNGGKDTTDLTDLNLTASVTVIPVNDAPTLQATPRTAGHGSAGVNATLFENVELSTVESRQTISKVTFTVTGLRDGADENLNLNDTRIALVNGAGSSGNYSYTVTLNGSTATVVVTATSASAGIAASDAQTLIAGASYTHLSETPSGGPRSFSLSVQDSGGTANTGVDTTTLTGTTVLTVARNTAPQLSGGPDLSNLSVAGSLTTVTGLDNLTASALSPGGEHLYVLDSDGELAILSRNATSGELRLLQTLDTSLTSASAVQLSADGSRVYVLGNDSDSLVVFSRSSDGSLAATQTLTTSNVVGLAASRDGAALYLINDTGLQVYNHDNNSQYSQAQSLLASADPRLAGAVQVEAANGYVYVLTAAADANAANTLIVYQAASDGQLNAVASLPGAQQGNEPAVVLDDAVAVAVSADGRTIFIASSTGVAQVSLDTTASTPSLSYNSPLSGLSNVTGVALSADADTLYVTSSDGSINRYKVEAGALTLLQGITATDQPALNGAAQVRAAGSDAVVVVGSGGIVSLNDRLASQIPLTYTEKGNSILLAETLRLSDADSDELANGAGNYKDASITVSRQGTANSADRYSLQAGDGLSLADGVVSLQGNAIASFVVNEGTLTLTFTADVSTATANAVLNRISYSNAGGDPDATLNLNLRFIDANSSSASTLLQLTVTTVNDAPTLTSTAAIRDFIRGGQAVSLFSDTAVSSVEAGQSINTLTLTVSGVSDGESEVLRADGSDIALVDGGSGTTSSGYTYSVALNAGVASVTFSASISASAAATLVDSLTYRNSSAEATLGNRTVSLTVLQDDGGTANGGSDTSNLTVSASVTVRDTPPVTPPVTNPNPQPPVTEPPVTQPPVTETPGTQPPTQPPVTQPPVAETPVTQPPLVTNPGTQTPVVTPPLTQPPVTAIPTPLPTVSLVGSQPAVADSTASFAESVFETNETDSVTEQPEPIAAPANAALTTREARWTSSSALNSSGETVTQQLVQADVLLSNNLSQPASSTFVFQGSALVAQVDSFAAGSRSVTLALPAQLPDGTVPSAVSLASGLPLPNWVRFDANSGELQIDRAQLERLGSVRLILTSRDIDGQPIQTELRIDDARQPAPRAAAPARDAEAQTTDAQDVPEQLRQSASNTLLDDARTLLESLSGLNAQTPAPARHTA